MSLAPPSPRRLAAAAAIALALAVVLLSTLAATPARSAGGYTAAAKREFMKACTTTADRNGTAAQARRYCSVTYRCLTTRITYRQLQSLGTGPMTPKVERALRHCTAKGNRAAFG